jgi:hypothetical protein
MQRLIYTVDIDDEFVELDNFHEKLDFHTENELGCSVVRSKLETPEEIILHGEWEDGEE